jgi:hypothetical protein
MRDARNEIKDIRDTIQFAMVVIIFFSTLLVSAKFSLSHAAISAPQLLDCEALLASL